MNLLSIIFFLLIPTLFSSKIIKERKRKLNSSSKATIILNGNSGETVKYINLDPGIPELQPTSVFLNDDDQTNHASSEYITLTENGENKLEIEWEDDISIMNVMFVSCSSIISIDFSNINSGINDMANSFYDCFSLKSINLLNFDTSNTGLMNDLFHGCSALLSLDLSNFRTSNVYNMGHIFYGCSSLVSLDLSTFDTSNLIYADNMFNGCSSLISLDISNFNIPSGVLNSDDNFKDCNQLKYINLENFQGNTDIFNSIPDGLDLIVCMNNYGELGEILRNKGATNDCSNLCFKSPTILNVDEKRCYYNCPLLEEGQFCNYDHTEIINTIPEGYFLNDTEGKTIDRCHHLCKTCTRYGDENNGNCTECITGYEKITDNFNKNPDNCFEKCDFYNYNMVSNEYECNPQGFSLFVDSATESVNEIINNLDDIMDGKEENNTYIINGNNFTIFINPIERNMEDYSNTIIDFSECLNVLKVEYPTFEFRIVQINIDNSNPQCLSNQVEYRIYNQYGQNMDLSCCEDVSISITNKISSDSGIDIEKIAEFKNKGIDIFQINSSFFNDICYSFSDGDSDIILKDRIADIYQNYSLCDTGCEYESFDIEKLASKCSCKVKQEISNNYNQEGNFKSYILNSFLSSNFGVIKCYKLVFGIKGKLKNIGFLIYGIMVLFHIPLYITYCIKSVNPVKNYIDTEMNNNHYKVHTKETMHTLETSRNNIEEGNNKNIFRKGKKKSSFHKINRKHSKQNKKNNKDNPPRKTKKSKTDIRKIKFEKKKPKKDLNSRDLFKKEKNKKKKMNNSVKSNKKKLAFKGNFINNRSSNLNMKKRRSILTNNTDNDNTVNQNDKISYNKNNFPLILINAKNKGIYRPLESNYVLNNYNYDEAIIYENRIFCRIFFIYLISKENILNLIFLKPPLELKPLRLCIFIFNYSCEFALNAFFYLSENISDIYHYSGANKLFFSLINNIVISLSSTIVSFILLFFFQSLTNSSNKITDLFRQQEKILKKNKDYQVNESTKLKIQDEIDKILKCLKIKIICFIIFEILTLLFFFYYVTAFCHVYKNTQISWIIDSLLSYVMSFAISVIFSFTLSIFYKISINNQIKILYSITTYLY